MNKNFDFEQEYINDIDSSAPDMDMLWARIADDASQADDADITPFADAALQCRKSASASVNNFFRTFTAAAAVLVAVISLSFVIGSDEIASGGSNDATANFNEQIMYEDSAESESSVISAVDGWDYSDSTTGENEYSALKFADTSAGMYTALSANPDNEEYFVEADVLDKTDYFLDCRIISSEMVSDDQIRYSVEVIHLISDNEMTISPVAEVYSSSPYALRNNREYLLPISENNDVMTVVFDNAPQIEISEDREVICHNGWKSLAKDSTAISYPRIYADDYFYDRMNITAEASLDELFDSWLEQRHM